MNAVLLFSDHLCRFNHYPLQSNQLAASPMLLFLLCWSRYVLFLLYFDVSYCCCVIYKACGVPSFGNSL
jgi:hypothetical protein